MRRHLLAIVAVGALAAIVIAFAPPLSHTTEAPARSAGGAASTAATTAMTDRGASAATAADAEARPRTPSAQAPAPAAGVGSSTSAPATRSLAAVVRGAISSASEALTAATSDDRVMYAAALRARDAGAYDYAISAFRSVVAHGGPLAPVASLRMAQAMVSADQRSPAATAFAEALARADLPPELVTPARLDAAANATHLGNPGAALGYLDAIRHDASASSYDRSSAAWQAAQIRRDAGETAWVDDAAAAITIQPASTAAPQALDAIESAVGGPDAPLPASVPALTAAYVRYRAYQNAAASARYHAIVSDSTSSHDVAFARFYLGALDERADDQQAALSDYARSIAADPTGPLADDARYWRARIYEERGDRASAVSEYDRLARDFPTSAFAPEARLRAALLVALGGDATDSLVRLDAIAAGTATSDPADAAAAARWSQVFRRLYGLPPDSALDPASFDPTALPSLLDAVGTTTLPAAATSEQPVAPTDTTAIEPWLAATFGPPAHFADTLTLVESPAYNLGKLLVGVGERSVGDTLLRNAVRASRANPYALFDIARDARDLDIPEIEMYATRTLFNGLSDKELIGAPKSLLALSYPTPYLSETSQYAKRYSLPPLLLTALVRQESAFDPSAGSSAGALGLAQVTPGTGQQIAQALGVPWTTSMLLDPSTSLQFGAYYLSTQLDSFGGNVFAALAAYNGGPGNAARWEAAAPFPGADGFLYAIDYSETDSYVSIVLENYAWYRYIYAGASAPSLR